MKVKPRCPAGVYSACLGLEMPCGRCYVHCRCPVHAHDKYIINVGDVRVMAAQAAASATHRPFKKS